MHRPSQAALYVYNKASINMLGYHPSFSIPEDSSSYDQQFIQYQNDTDSDESATTKHKSHWHSRLGQHEQELQSSRLGELVKSHNDRYFGGLSNSISSFHISSPIPHLPSSLPSAYLATQADQDCQPACYPKSIPLAPLRGLEFGQCFPFFTLLFKPTSEPSCPVSPSPTKWSSFQLVTSCPAPRK